MVRSQADGVMACYKDLTNVEFVTMAPELDHALEAISYLVSQGVKVSVGHTEANLAVGECFPLWACKRPYFMRSLRGLPEMQRLFARVRGTLRSGVLRPLFNNQPVLLFCGTFSTDFTTYSSF
jgi:hypothetical protein